MDEVESVDDLAGAVANYGFAYLLTVSADGRPHAVAVTPRLTGANLHIGDVGSRSLRNLATRPDVSVVWPPPTVYGYSLIADGVATAGEGEGAAAVVIAPNRAVLHRPGRAAQEAPPSAGCASDCRELGLPA